MLIILKLALPGVAVGAVVPGSYNAMERWERVRLTWPSAPESLMQDDFICPADRKCGIASIMAGENSKGSLYICKRCASAKKDLLILGYLSVPKVTISTNVTLCLKPLSQSSPNATCPYVLPPYSVTTVNLTNATQWKFTNYTEMINVSKVAFRTLNLISATPVWSNSHIIPIPHTCQRIAHAHTHTQVYWVIEFPELPKCRTRRAWYDTFLGGAGTGLGILNSIDSEITTRKLDSTGRLIHQAMSKVGQWMPSGVLNEKYQASWSLLASRMMGEMNKDERWSNVSQWFNWTECNLKMVNVKQQMLALQRMATTDNAQQWRLIWNIRDDIWLKIHPQHTQCSLSKCEGVFEMFNVTHSYTACKFHVIPIIAGEQYWTLEVQGEWFSLDTNHTYCLDDCDLTDFGSVCSLRTGYVNPCITTGQGVCQWRHSPPVDTLYEVGPRLVGQTITTKNSIEHLGKVIEFTSQDSWWNIFEGWSPKARHLLDVLVHPIVVLCVFSFLLVMEHGSLSLH